MERDDEVDSGISEADVAKMAGQNRIVMFIALFVSVCIICVMGAGLFVLFKRVDKATRVATVDVTKRLDEMDATLVTLQEELEKSRLQLTNFQSRIDNFDSQFDSSSLQQLSEKMIEREKDFRILLKATSDGTVSLAKMMRGNRSWLEPFQKELLELRESSAMRSAELEKSVP